MTEGESSISYTHYIKYTVKIACRSILFVQVLQCYFIIPSLYVRGHIVFACGYVFI